MDSKDIMIVLKPFLFFAHSLYCQNNPTAVTRQASTLTHSFN